MKKRSRLLMVDREGGSLCEWRRESLQTSDQKWRARYPAREPFPRGMRQMSSHRATRLPTPEPPSTAAVPLLIAFVPKNPVQWARKAAFESRITLLRAHTRIHWIIGRNPENRKRGVCLYEFMSYLCIDTNGPKNMTTIAICFKPAVPSNKT